MYWWLFLLCPIAYLWGGLNFSKIIARLRHVDLTAVGSGNAGATNVGRALGFGWFLVVTILELLKGAMIVAMGYLFGSVWQGNYNYLGSVDHYVMMLAVGIAGLLGDIFPVWYHFRGGKGIATWIGMGFFLNPIMMLIDAVVFIPLLCLTRIMSISTLLGAVCWALLTFTPVSWIFQAPFTWYLAVLYGVIVVLLFFSHRKNLVRLFTGQEKKVSFKK